MTGLTAKIKSAEAHFHPFQVGAPRPEEAHKAIDAFCDKFAAGLADPKNDALLNLFAEDGSWADPVGGPPPYVGRDKLAERITKLPAMDFAKVVEVFYTVNDKIFLCKTEVKFKDKPNSFFILDKFVVDSGLTLNGSIAGKMADSSIVTAIRGAFGKLDTNNDGTLSQQELSKLLVKIGMTQEDVQSIFESMNTNGDMRISIQEFIDWALAGKPAM